MSDEKHPLITDIVGIKPIGEAIGTISIETTRAAVSFLGRLCNPAAEEFGLMLQDTVRVWRANNMVRLTAKAEEKLQQTPNAPELHASPSLVSRILENGSWTEDSVVQDMWAGLLASSCTPDGDDDSNLLFTELLSRMTTVQAAILNYACENAPKSFSKEGLCLPLVGKFVNVHPYGVMKISIEELKRVAGTSDINRLDREIDHLKAMGLLAESAGFLLYPSDPADVAIDPAPLALEMFIRCQGSRKSAADFYDTGAKDGSP